MVRITVSWRKHWLFTVVCAVLLFFVVLPYPLSGQTFDAQITGIVQDATGGVITGAELVATDLAKGTKYTTETNAQGIYRFQSLPPTQYSLSCSMKGFKKFENTSITLQVNQVLQLDIALQTGSVEEQITVTAEPPALETASSDVGQVVTTRSVEELPLDVRDSMALVGLTPGVTFGPNFGNGGGMNVGRNFFKSDFNVGGGRSGSQEILLDGVPNTTGDSGRAVINLPVDAVQEFKVQATSYDAQFGRTSGGIVNIIGKSGGNEIHGSVYGFERNSVLDANNWLNKKTGTELPAFRRHQFGGVVGGPIRKDKWFFFADYEGLRQAFPQTTLSTVPTELQRQGDFSQTFTADGKLVTIYDPATLSGSPKKRSAFPNNTIPEDRMDPAAKALLRYYPLPNLPGDAITQQNNYIYTANSITNSNKFDVRSDVNIDSLSRVFFRFSRQADNRVVPGSLPPLESGTFTHDRYHQFVASYSRIISPTLLLNLQTSFTRAMAQQEGGLSPVDLTSLGFDPSFANVVAQQVPSITVQDMASLTMKSAVGQQRQPRNNYVTSGNVTNLRGKHNLKFGGDMRFLGFNEYQNSNSSGSFTFKRQFTQGPGPTTLNNNAGHGFASFLLGDASSGTARNVQGISTRGLYFSGYLQDDYRVTNRLTLNMGLRWEVTVGNREKGDRLAYFDPDALSPLGPTIADPTLKGIVDWVGDGRSRNQQETQWGNFGPRFGFAYQLDSKTVVRGGYGIFYVPRSIQGNGDGALENFVDTTMLATIDKITPANVLSNPFPQGIRQATSDRNPLAGVGSSINVPMYDFTSPYVQMWSFGIQRQLPGKVLMDVHYWGNKGTHLLTTEDGNQMPDEYLALGSALTDQVPNPFYGIITTGSLATATISREQSLRPFPQYYGDSGIEYVFKPVAKSSYNALTVQGERRLSKSLTFLANYSWQKAMDDLGNPLDAYNPGAEWAISSFDATQQFGGSFVANLPFGRGRKFASTWRGWKNNLLGEWNLSSIIRLQVGMPVSVIRPSVLIGDPKLDHPTPEKWFNTAVITTAPTYTFGNLGPVLPGVRSDGIKNVDMVLGKNIRFVAYSRECTAQLRFEVFNLFNRTQYAAPDGSPSSLTFGEVTDQQNNPRDIQVGLKIRF